MVFSHVFALFYSMFFYLALFRNRCAGQATRSPSAIWAPGLKDPSGIELYRVAGHDELLEPLKQRRERLMERRGPKIGKKTSFEAE